MGTAGAERGYSGASVHNQLPRKASALAHLAPKPLFKARPLFQLWQRLRTASHHARVPLNRRPHIHLFHLCRKRTWRRCITLLKMHVAAKIPTSSAPCAAPPCAGRRSTSDRILDRARDRRRLVVRGPVFHEQMRGDEHRERERCCERSAGDLMHHTHWTNLPIAFCAKCADPHPGSVGREKVAMPCRMA